jgi:hypothetical protein
MYSTDNCFVTFVYLDAYISEGNTTGQGEGKMISYIVGRNFGHLNRAVAIIEKFHEANQEEIVRIYTFPHSFSWIKENIPFVELDCFKKYKKYSQLQNEIRHSSLIMHDWRMEVRKLRSDRKEFDAIMGGIYHSDLKIYDDDMIEARNFKEFIRNTANETTDIFFHINLVQPNEVPDLSTFYVPIPLIARDVTMSANEVKESLGLQPDEPFLLMQMGGGVGPSKYKYTEEWYDKINQLRLPIRIVVANQFAGLPFPFHANIIQAPLFYNGINLINAADVVISKPGMGILTDAIATQTPLLLLPPDDAERQAKHDMLQKIIGSDIGTIEANFSKDDLSRRINEILDQKNKITEAFQTIPHNGAEIMSKAINLLCGKPLNVLPFLYEEVLKLTPFSV